jgi:hypothetical protein
MLRANRAMNPQTVTFWASSGLLSKPQSVSNKSEKEIMGEQLLPAHPASRLPSACPRPGAGQKRCIFGIAANGALALAADLIRVYADASMMVNNGKSNDQLLRDVLPHRIARLDESGA